MMMRKLNIALLLTAVMAFSSCQIIGGIFKAGVAVGIVVILVIVFILIWIISLFRK